MKQRKNRELFICTRYNIYKDDLIFKKKKHYYVKELKSFYFCSIFCLNSIKFLFKY